MRRPRHWKAVAVFLAVLGWAFAIWAPSATAASGASTRIAHKPFGQAGGEPVEIYTLTNAHHVEARVMTYGATLVSLRVPDRHGKLENVVLGFDTLQPYVAGVPYFGATVGRYANRIAKAQFTLDGQTYALARNNGPNSLHGGAQGFDKRLWKAEVLESAQGPALRLSYVSAAGEEGYPGALSAHVTYRLGDDDTLDVAFDATTTASTPVNLVNHAYFNLTGKPTHSILDHVLTIDADRITPVDEALIPTGELKSVEGTPFDFRRPRTIGARIDAPDEQLRLGHGYDHNWVLNKPAPHALSLAAVLEDPQSGRRLEVRTTQPGLQFYTGNFLDGLPAGKGSVYAYRTALCLETQHFPDSPNHPSFPSTILRPGETYHEETQLTFRVQ